MEGQDRVTTGFSEQSEDVSRSVFVPFAVADELARKTYCESVHLATVLCAESPSEDMVSMASMLPSVPDRFENHRQRAHRIAQEFEETFRAASEEDAEKEIQFVERTLQPLLDTLAKIAKSSEPSERVTSTLIGDCVYELSQQDAAELAKTLSSVISSFFNPTKIRRNANALELPYRCVLEVDPTLKPIQEGLSRKYRIEHLQEMVKQLKTMALADVVEPASATCRWAHACVLAKKADGSLRFCIDYKPLNSKTHPELYAVPDVREVCELLAREGRVFCKFDLKSAYWQVPIDEESRPYTAFFVPGYGLWQFRVVAFGLTSAVGLFQRIMEKIFAPLLHRGVVVYLDDMIVYAKDTHEMTKLIKEVHTLLAAYDLRLAPNKCEHFSEYFVREVMVLGSLVSAGTIRQNPSHLQAIREYPRPTTVSEMQRFLGMATWHRRSVPRFAQIVAPLLQIQTEAQRGHGARKKDRSLLTWTKEAVEAFDDIREKLVSPPVTVVPDMNKLSGRLLLMSDGHGSYQDGSSAGGLGALLYWKKDDGQYGLVMAISRALTKGERNYPATKLECAALIEGARAAEKYLWMCREGEPARCLVDHKCLRFLVTIRDRSEGIMSRWAAYLLSLNIVLEYRPGPEHVSPDAISRATSSAKPVWHGKRYGDITLGDVDNTELFDDPSCGDPETSFSTSVEQSTTAVAAFDVLREDVFQSLTEIAASSVRFSVAIVDAPVQYHCERSWSPKYDTLSFEQLSQLPLGAVMEEDAAVFAWSTSQHVADMSKLLSCWGFENIRIVSVWDKVSRTPSLFGSVQCEFVLFATRGNWKKRFSQQGTLPQLWSEQRVGRHSTKPAFLHEFVRTSFSGRFVELFGCRAQRDFLVIGNEASKDGVARRVRFQEPIALAPLTRSSSGISCPSQRALSSEKKEKKSKPAVRVSQPVQRADEWMDGSYVQLRSSEQFAVEDARVLEVNSKSIALANVVDPRTRAVVRTLLADSPLVMPRSSVDEKHTSYVTKLVEHHNARLRWVRLSKAEVVAWCDENLPLAQRGPNVPLVVLDSEAGQSWVSFSELQKSSDIQSFLAAYITVCPLESEVAFVPNHICAYLFRTALIRRCHQSCGHFGAQKTKDQLRYNGWFLFDLNEDLTRILRECPTCGISKGYPAATWEAGPRPSPVGHAVDFNHRVRLDIWGPANQSPSKRVWILSMTDEATRLNVISAMNDDKASTVAEHFLRNWISVNLPPRNISSDRGAQFTSEILKELSARWSFGQLMTTPWHPQGNAIEEERHKQHKNVLMKMLDQFQVEPSKWVDLLAYVQLVLRVTTHKATGKTPYELVYHRRPVLPDAIVHSPVFKELSARGVVRLDGPVPSRPANFKPDELMDKVLRAVLETPPLHSAVAECAREDGSVARPVQRSRRPEYKAGDWVRVWVGRNLKTDPLVLNAKLAPHRWTEPWKVIAVTDDGAVLQLVKGTDPLVEHRVSWMNVKRAYLDQETEERLNRVVEETMRQKEQVRHKVELAQRAFAWVDEAAGDDCPQFEVDRVLSTFTDGRGKRMVKVLWKDGKVSDEALTEFAVDAPEAWKEFCERNTRKTKSARRSGVRK